MPLNDFVGEEGLIHFAYFLDVGPHHDPDYSGPQVVDFRGFTELFRRLHLPFYEEARKYWADAEESGFFSDANEIFIYLPSTLKKMIERFGGGV